MLLSEAKESGSQSGELIRFGTNLARASYFRTPLEFLTLAFLGLP